MAAIMTTRIFAAVLLLACLSCWGCRGATVDQAAPAPASLPTIVLDAAPGIIQGTPVVARGITIGAVVSTTLEQQRVVVTARLDPGHRPTLGAGACVRVGRDAQAAVLVLVLGEGETAPTQLERCEGPDVLAAAERQPSASPQPDPEPSEPDPEPSEPGPEPSAPDPKPKPKPAQHSCGDDLSFSTVSVTDVDAIPLHLPNGGWRAKIRFTNDGGDFVEIDPVTTAAFMDKSGAALNVASLPSSRDWFMPFQLPPHSSKEVEVTFHHDGGPKPWVQRVKYSWSCD